MNDVGMKNIKIFSQAIIEQVLIIIFLSIIFGQMAVPLLLIVAETLSVMLGQ